MENQGIGAGRDSGVLVVAIFLAAATIGLELVVPLGYAVWLLYFLAIGVTVFQSRAWLPLAVAALACTLLVVGFNVAPPSGKSFAASRTLPEIRPSALSAKSTPVVSCPRTTSTGVPSATSHGVGQGTSSKISPL